MSVSQETETQAATRPTWHASEASAVAQELGVEPEGGLSVEEARRRLQRIFGTVELSFTQWSICIGIAASLVVVEELIKLVIRRRDRQRVTPPTEPALSGA